MISVKAVAENILAALLAASGQKTLESIRGAEWERQVEGAYTHALTAALAEAASDLEEPARAEAAHAFSRMLASADASRRIVQLLARSFLDTDAKGALSDWLRHSFGPDVDFLEAQGIDFDLLVATFPQALLEHLTEVAEPDQPMFGAVAAVALSIQVRGLQHSADAASEKLDRLVSAPRIRGTGLPPQVWEFADVAETSGQEQDRQIVQALAKVISPRHSNDLSDATKAFERLLADLSHAVYRGGDDKLAQAIVVDDGLDRLIAKRPQAAALLPRRASLRERQGRWVDALQDYRTFVDQTTTTPSGPFLLRAGTLLMTLGSYPDARRLLRQAKSQGLDPLDASAASEVELWIDDYQGQHDAVVRRSRGLLHAAMRVDAPTRHLAGIRHRMGRAAFAAALAAGNDRALLERSLRLMQRAWDLNGRSHPFDAFWIYRISEALQTKDRELRWGEAQEQMLSLHDSAAAHLHLVSGMKACRLELPFSAVDHLTRALDLWKRYAYPKGTFDASLQLGDAYSQLGSSLENRMRAVLHYRLADRLGSRLRLARHGEAQRKLATAVHRIAMTPAYLIKQADEQLDQLSYSQMMAGWSFPSS